MDQPDRPGYRRRCLVRWSGGMAGTNPLNGLDPISTTVAASKTMSDTKLGIGNMVCTASFADGSYGEELDRRAGIRLDGVTVPAGNIIEVIGTLSTTTNGERCLTNCFYRTKDPMTLSPIAMTNRAIGGATLGSPPAGQQGIKNAAGANNIGLLVRTWARWSKWTRPCRSPRKPGLRSMMGVGSE